MATTKDRKNRRDAARKPATATGSSKKPVKAPKEPGSNTASSAYKPRRSGAATYSVTGESTEQFGKPTRKSPNPYRAIGAIGGGASLRKQVERGKKK